MKDRMDLDRIAFIGRTFGEYAAMFALDECAPCRRPVLDCPAGAASFTAEASRLGMDVTACDILYDLPASRLYEKGTADLSYIFDERFDRASHLYTWEYYTGKADVIACRERALETFAADFPVGVAEGRYVRGELPGLPFRNGEFGLALSSHLLFLYGDRLDLEFHVRSLFELVRVATEVRVFPLQGLDARPSPHLERVTDVLAGKGVMAEMVRVPFEFQRGADTMLRLFRYDRQYGR